MDNNSMQQLFCNAGLSERHALVFAHLFEAASPVSAGLIAKRLKLKRSTTYSTLEELVGIGIVKRSKKEKITLFKAIEPEVLIEIIKERVNSQVTRSDSAIKALTKLAEERNSASQNSFANFAGIDFEVIESREAVYEHMYFHATKGSYCAIMNPNVLLSGDGKQKIKKFLDKTAQTMPKIQELVVASEASRWYKKNIKNPNHKIKEICLGENFTIDLILTNNEVIISNYLSGSELAIKIKQKALYNSLMEVFERLWERELK